MAEELPAGVVVPQVDFEIQQLTVGVLFEGPRRSEYADDAAQRLANEHLQYIIGLRAAGKLLGAGALIDADAGQRLTGLGFSTLPADELLPLLQLDPAVVAGMEAVKVVTFAFPKGMLAFPRG